MQRIIDDPTLVVEDMLRGFVRAHPDLVAATDDPRVLRAAGGAGQGQGRRRHRRRLRAQAGLHRLSRAQHGRCRGRRRDLHLTIGLRVPQRVPGRRRRRRRGLPVRQLRGRQHEREAGPSQRGEGGHPGRDRDRQRRRALGATGRSARSDAASPARCSCGRSVAPRRPWAARSTRSSRPRRRPSTTPAASGWA